MRDGEGPGGFTRPVFLRRGRGPVSLKRVMAGVLSGLLAWSCGGEEGPGPAGPAGSELQISIVSGDGQEGRAGTSLPDFLVVRVSVGPTEPAQRVPVEWTVIDGEAEISRKGPDTDGQGLSAAVLFVSGQPGERVVRAGLENGSGVLFTAHVLTREPPPAPPGRGRRAGT
jgi:hypothetical protein